MIREVHIYGQAALIASAEVSGSSIENPESHKRKNQAQHLGLGSNLVANACTIAQEAGFESIRVISAIGTREYYRNLGFRDAGLYQMRELG